MEATSEMTTRKKSFSYVCVTNGMLYVHMSWETGNKVTVEGEIVSAIKSNYTS